MRVVKLALINLNVILTLYLIETPFYTFAKRAEPGSTLFALGNISVPTLVDLTSNFFVLCTNIKVYQYN